MTREIKFRAFHPEEKKMYEIDLQKYMGMNEYAQDKEMPMEARHNGLMQFTGLLDKNGKEVWEGDIVEEELGTRKRRWVIKYRGNSFAPCTEDNSLVLYKYSDLIVIGNQFENPELLTK